MSEVMIGAVSTPSDHDLETDKISRSFFQQRRWMLQCLCNPYHAWISGAPG